MAEYDPVEVLGVLTAHQVRFVLIGGVAARLRGAPLLTQDIDITPELSRSNLEALAAALRDLGARLRTASGPEGLPFPLEGEMLAAGISWTLTTRAGDVDLWFQPSGTGGFPDLAAHADPLTVSRHPPLVVLVASLADVIRSKEASGRDKDRMALPLLRRTLEEIDRQERSPRRGQR